MTTTVASPKPPTAKTEGDKPAKVKVGLTIPRSAVSGDSPNTTRYIIGRRTVGEPAGLSAFPIHKDYKPDLTRIPTGDGASVVLTVESGYVVGVGLTATL